jgi:succinate dehydrogenase / fumarate reductase, cytochrome b subunit
MSFQRGGGSWAWVARYRGQTGQWAHVLHRLTGIGIITFLLLHIVDTAVLGWGPDAYDALANFWHQPLFRIGQVGLLGVLLFHSINGIRILLIDFTDWGALNQERLFWVSLVLTLVLFIPGAYLMFAPLFVR